MSTFLILLEYWSPVSLNFGRNLKKQKNHCFSSIGWFFDQIALKQKSRKANMLCRSFSVLEIFETSPSFHIKLFFNLQWRSKNGLFEVCTLRHKFPYVTSSDLFITAWIFLTSKQFSCLECKPFSTSLHNAKNDLVSRKSLLRWALHHT